MIYKPPGGLVVVPGLTSARVNKGRFALSAVRQSSVATGTERGDLWLRRPMGAKTT